LPVPIKCEFAQRFRSGRDLTSIFSTS